MCRRVWVVNDPSYSHTSLPYNITHVRMASPSDPGMLNPALPPMLSPLSQQNDPSGFPTADDTVTETEVADPGILLSSETGEDSYQGYNRAAEKRYVPPIPRGRMD